MEIITIDQSDRWDAWLLEQQGSFLQSWGWGEVLRAEGKEVERLAVVDAGQVVAQAQVIYQNLPFGWRYGFCAKGPVFRKNEEVRMKNEEYILLINFLKEKSCIFFRIEPLQATSYKLQATVRDINPRTTTILDLSKSEDELLGAMQKKTRYSIRTAESKQVTVSNKKDVQVLWQLLQQTGKRDKFNLHPKRRYESVLASTLSHQIAAFQGDKVVATAIFVGFGNTFTYLYAASDYEYHDLLAPYLIQWEAIKLAKKLGYKQYDFFGIAPRKHDTRDTQNGTGGNYDYDRKHPYAGITKFKIGFGGEVVESPGTFDIILNSTSYHLYSWLRRLRRLV
ncbi:MAG TPA: peptidoglycan bridge formation glycyltransferase FemA/FemB family protein [Patescibacteria group bacterium]|nr:peptidoglycan bridge formation glycyltransferase FemA/FemB family protein [Patescibacteria group bacterium]